MKHNRALLLLMFLAAVSSFDAQTQDRALPREDRIVITTNLVQLDAVVTDKNGKPVSDLRAEDFELIEAGRVRDIIAFSYIDLAPKSPSEKPDQRTRASTNATGPPVLHGLDPESVRRAIVILVDDFGLSFESIARLREALEQYIVTHTVPGDVIAIVRSSGGPGSMQQFTSNRAQVLATIKRLRWYPTARGRMAGTDSLSPQDNNEDGIELRGYSSAKPPDLSSREFFGGSFGALGFVLDRLALFPGRKSIVVVSENYGAAAALDDVIQKANQYSIVISTIDARGMPKPGLTADDTQHNLAANQIEKRMRERALMFTRSQDALSYLAAGTGGIFIRNNNDLTDALRQTIDSEKGYYLLAYRPDDADKERPTRAYKVTLRLKRPELVLRSRSNFHRVPAAPPELRSESTAELLRDALISPFVKEDLRLKVTAVFTGRKQIKLLTHIDARDLSFTKLADGNHRATVDFAAVVFDDNGRVTQQFARNYPLTVNSDEYDRILRDGLVYHISIPVRQSGPYQVRVAVRDENSGRLGSNSQFVEIPEPNTSRLTVAGLLMQSTAVNGGPAVRRFKGGEKLEYSYLVYGARTNGRNATDLTSQVRLFRGTEQVFAGDALPTSGIKETKGEALIAGGTLSLGTTLPPGEYFLQVIVTDRLAPLEKQTSYQWIDFEIAP